MYILLTIFTLSFSLVIVSAFTSSNIQLTSFQQFFSPSPIFLHFSLAYACSIFFPNPLLAFLCFSSVK